MAVVLRTPSRRGEEAVRTGETSSTLMKLRKLFRYEPITGQLLRLTNQSSNARRGDVVGSPHNAGYLQLQAGGEKYLAHRVAWVLMTGQDVEGVEIDHRNGNRADNRWSNLRLASSSQQRGNRTVKGYSRRSRNGKDKYIVNFRHKYVGCYKTQEEAQNAYRQKAEEFWGDYAGHRR